MIPGLGRSLGEGNGYPLQYPGLENSMDCIVHGVAKSQTEQLSLSLHSSQEIVVFTGGSVVKNLLAKQEMLGWEDPL